jgi:hypothetical protein
MPGGGGMKSEGERHVVQVDQVLAHEGNKPTKVKRHFDKVGGKTSFNENDMDVESPFEGATVELTGDGADVKLEFVEGKKPDHEGALEGHKLALALDALLPDKEVEKDSKWELDNAQIRRAIGADLLKAFYPPPQRDDSAGGGGGGGGQRRGGGMRGGADRILALAEFTGKAKVVALDEEVDGHKCVKVEIEISAKGSMPEPQMGGGRRGRMLEPEASLAFESTYTVSAQGAFYFSLDGKRPVKLELEGTIGSVSDREMKGRGDDETMHKMHSSSDGKLSLKVEVSEEAVEKKAK